MNRNKTQISFVCLALVTVLTTGWAASISQQRPMKNVIILIPDGCNAAETTLTRWYLQWNPAELEKFAAYSEPVSLAVDEMNVGCFRNWATNSMVTDSAPAATAFATGYKSADKFISVLPDAATIPGYTLPAAQDYYRPIPTILEGAKRVGKAVGLVATSNVQHATPAAFSGHVSNRALYNELAEQQVYMEVDVMFGGGRQYLVPKPEGKRTDGQNLVSVLENRGYEFLTTRDELLALNPDVTKVWGLFAKDAMAYEFDRVTLAPTEPSLAEMTDAAIDVLSRNPKGFFLMVEGSEVDWASHANDPIGVVGDVIAFDAAVQAAMDFAKADKNTLVLVLTDHGCGGMSIGNKKTDETYSKMPWTSVVEPLSHACLTGQGIEKLLLDTAADRDGDGVADDVSEEDIRSIMAANYGISNLTADTLDENGAVVSKGEVTLIQERIAALINEKITPPASGLYTYGLNYVIGPMISSRSNIGWTTMGHTGEDLFVYAYGNTRELGTIDNTDIAKLCAKAMGFDLKKLESILFVPAESAFASMGAEMQLTSQVTEVTVIKKIDNTYTSLKLKQLVPVDLIITKGSLTATLPIGTDVIRISKTTRRGNVAWTLELNLDGLTLYTAPYKTASTPDGVAPDLDRSRVFVPSLAVKAVDLLYKWFR